MGEEKGGKCRWPLDSLALGSLLFGWPGEGRKPVVADVSFSWRNRELWGVGSQPSRPSGRGINSVWISRYLTGFCHAALHVQADCVSYKEMNHTALLYLYFQRSIPIAFGVGSRSILCINQELLQWNHCLLWLISRRGTWGRTHGGQESPLRWE